MQQYYQIQGIILFSFKIIVGNNKIKNQGTF